MFFYNINLVPFVDLCFFFPEFFISLVILYLLILGLFFLRSNLEMFINSVFSRLTLVFLFFAFLLNYNLPNVSIMFFDSSLCFDFFIKINKFFLIFLLFLSVLSSPSYLSFFKLNKFEFFSFILIIFLASSFLLMSNDFLLFYLSLELQSLTFYLLASFKKDSPFSAEAGLKYFILGALSSGLLLFGLSLIYGITGTLNFFSLSLLFLDFNSFSFFSYPLVFGLILVLSSFFFKLAVAPFHMWSPDVYEGSPLVSVIFLAVISKFVLFVVLSRLVFFVFFDIFLIFDYILTIVIFFSFFVSVFNALQQKKFKRFFAYSSISHVAFILLALNSLNFLGFVSFYFYLYSYSLMNLLVWVLLVALKNPFNRNLFSFILNLSNLSKINVSLSFCFFIVLMSMAGIPPFLGFFSKFWVFISGLSSGQFFVVFVALFSSVISCFYYLRFVKIIFFEKSKYFPILSPLNKSQSFVISLLTISLVFFFIFSDVVFSFFYYFYLSFYGLL